MFLYENIVLPYPFYEPNNVAAIILISQREKCIQGYLGKKLS